MDELDLSIIRYGGANVTGFRLVDRENVHRTRTVQRLWARLSPVYQRHLPAGNLLKVIFLNVIITITIFTAPLFSSQTS